MRHKSEAEALFEQILANTRADGVPSQMIIVRLDGGGEFHGGKFGDLCRSRGITQEFRIVYELSRWGWLPATKRGRTRGLSQRLVVEPVGRQLRMNHEVADVLLVAAYEWTKSGSILKITS